MAWCFYRQTVWLMTRSPLFHGKKLFRQADNHVVYLNLNSALIYTELMPTPAVINEYMSLSVSERIQLVEDIWDSITAEAPDTVALSEAQKTELHRRLAEHRADPSTAIPWEQVRSKLFPSKP